MNHGLYVRELEVQWKDVVPPFSLLLHRFYSYGNTMSTPGVNPALTQSSQVDPVESRSSRKQPSTPQPEVERKKKETKEDEPEAPTIIGSLLLLLTALGGFWGFLIHAAAAKLSYDKYQSVGWAILDFIFGSLYIPYYAFFLNNQPQPSLIGGRRRR
jgi:hypothetical protein